MRTNWSNWNSRPFAMILLAACAALCGARGAAAQTRFSERNAGSGSHWHGWFPLQFSPDGRLLALPAGRREGEQWSQDVELWDLREGRTAATLAHPDGRSKLTHLSRIWFLGDGRTLAAVFHDADRKRPERSQLAFYDVATSKHRASVAFGKQGGPRALAFSPDGAQFAMALGSGPSDQRFEISVWDVASASLVKSLDEAPGCTDVAYSPDGKWLATVHGFSDAKGQVIVWDAETLERRQVLRAGGGHLSLAFSPDSKLLAASVNRHAKLTKPQPGVRLWDVATGKERGWMDGSEAALPVASVVAMFVPGSRFLVANCALAPLSQSRSQGQIKLWDTASGAQSVLDQGPQLARLDLFHGIDASPDGKLMAEGVLEAKPAVRLWDARYWRPLRTLEMSSTNASPRGWPAPPQVFFSPDGKWLAAALTVNGWHSWEAFVWDASEFATKPAKSPVSPGSLFPARP